LRRLQILMAPTEAAALRLDRRTDRTLGTGVGRTVVGTGSSRPRRRTERDAA
jgi:hypothetical protein